MKKLFSLFASVLATMVATPVIAQIPFDYGYWDATEFGYGLNPPIYPPTAGAFGNIGAYAEFIYFRPSEDNTFAYSISSYTHSAPSTTLGLPDTDTASYHRAKFEPNYKPGYRVGVLLALPCDQWGIDANYTYFYSKTHRRSPIVSFHDTVDPDSYTVLDPYDNSGAIVETPYVLDLFSEVDTFGDLTTQVSSHWKLRYNQVDVDLTRRFYVGPAVTLRPYFGFRGLFIQQHVDSFGVRNFAATSLPGASYDSTISQFIKGCSDGYGLHGGSEVSFDLFDGFSIFGDVGIGLLWTHYTTRFHRIQVATSPSTGLVDQTLIIPFNKESFDVMRFCADLCGGVEWRTLFNCSSNELFIRFAWEHHLYVNQNVFRTYLEGERDFADTSLGALLHTNGDLALYGFSVGAGFTF